MRLQFGGYAIDIEPWGSRVTFPGGAEILGAPEDTDAYRATAAQHGYGADTLRLCQEHELAHVALAHWLGLPVSPVLAAVAAGSPHCDLLELEENAVLAIQAFARAAGIDLVRALSTSSSRKE